jgi:DNA-binding HxlR family transcriptional regulator
MTDTTHRFRSGCPIATTLDILGDNWTLVIVRDMVSGKRRFSEFLTSPERITTSVLSARLGAMVAHGLAEKVRYQHHPPRHDYHLTAKGKALLPVLQEICRWSNRFIPGTWPAPDEFMAARLDDRPAEG